MIALPVSQVAAKAEGSRFYFTGRPCSRGHVCARAARNGECTECARARASTWYATHQEQGRARTARWRARHPEKVKVQTSSWRARNPEKARELLDKWRRENPARVRLHAARVNAKAPEKNRERVKAWNAANPEKKRALGRNRRARVLGAVGKHTAADIEALLVLQKGKCAYCRDPLAGRHCVDHIVPLAGGGTNDRRNLQLTCRVCNSRKHAKHPVAFAQELGRLL